MSKRRNEFFPHDDEDDDDDDENNFVDESSNQEGEGVKEREEDTKKEQEEEEEEEENEEETGESGSEVDGPLKSDQEDLVLIADDDFGLSTKEVNEEPKVSTSDSSGKGAGSNCGQHGGIATVIIKPECYLLLKMALEARELERSRLPVRVESLTYGEGKNAVEVRYRCLGEGRKEVEAKSVMVALYGLTSSWEWGVMKVASEKLRFMRSTEAGRRHLVSYARVDLRGKKGEAGRGVIQIREEKLHAAATVEGGIEFMKQQLEREVVSKSKDLKDEEKLLLELKGWSDFKSKEGEKLLVFTQDEEGGKIRLVVIGLGDAVPNFWEKVGKYFNENSNFAIKVHEKREVVIKFLRFQCKDIIHGCSGRVKVTYGKDNVEISGIKCDVKTMEEVVRKLIDTLKIFSFDECQPGLSASLFKKQDGNLGRFLREIETLNKCSIWVTDKIKPFMKDDSSKNSGGFVSFIKYLRQSMFGNSEAKSEAKSKDSYSPTTDDSHSAPGIAIHSGCITSSQHSKVLVNTLVRKRSNLLNGGAISRAFLSAGGDQLRHEFEQHDPPQIFGSDLVITKAAGNLQCQEIFHIYLSKFRNAYSLKLLKNSIKNCLEEAEHRGHDSIAFPTMGCGKLGYTINDVSRFFREAHEEFKDYSSGTLEINIFAMDQLTLHQFRDNFSTKTVPVSADRVVPENEEEEFLERIVTFTMCLQAENLKKFEDIKKYLKDKLKLHFKEKKIKHDMVEYYEALSDSCRKKLEALKLNEYHCQLDKSTNTIILRGPADELKGIKDKVMKILDEEAELLKNPAHLKSVKGAKAYLEFYSRSEEIFFPQHWRSYRKMHYDQSQPLALTVLKPNELAFKAICNLISKTWDSSKARGLGQDAKNLAHSNIEVKQIKVIENPELFLQYWNSRKGLCYKALNVGSRNQIDGITTQGEQDILTKKESKYLDEMLIPEINECYLFHGSKSDKIEHIINQGIDNRVCSNNAMFGKGAYFAESPTKADQYTDPKTGRVPLGQTLQMILARVSLGSSYVCGKPFPYSRPPCSNAKCINECSDSTHRILDSVVGTCRNDGTRLLFREFVVYKSDQCYPEFLIDYVRK